MVGRLQHVRYRQVLWTPLVRSANHKQSECTASYLRNKLLRVRSRVPNERGRGGALDVRQASRKQRQGMGAAYVLLPALVPPELVI